MKQIIECVPNFSEGINPDVIRQITDAIETVEGIKLLNVDLGRAANRTVVTFAGAPMQVIEAAFRAIKIAGELIDMSRHKGEHPRMGATDVCPLVPIAGITLEETAGYARLLAGRVGRDLHIPVYLYEYAQPDKSRSSLSVIRAGGYEGFFNKIKQPNWLPDYGPAENDVKRGVTVIGARDILIAYNVNLDTTSAQIANEIAFEVRESGRVLRKGDSLTGALKTDTDGKPVRVPGLLKSVKAIGWFIEEYGIAQVSMNLTNIGVTPVHIAFDEVCKKAVEKGTKVTGSELIGLIPLKAMLEAGRYFLQIQARPVAVSDRALIDAAVCAMRLDELLPFDPEKKIIEYLLEMP